MWIKDTLRESYIDPNHIKELSEDVLDAPSQQGGGSGQSRSWWVPRGYSTDYIRGHHIPRRGSLLFRVEDCKTKLKSHSAEMGELEPNGVLAPQAKAAINSRPISSYQKSNITLVDRFIDESRKLRVAVIGAGLAGVNAGILLPAKVPSIDLVIYEKNGDVGGTWLENIYPGVRCDIPAHVYQR